MKNSGESERSSLAWRALPWFALCACGPGAQGGGHFRQAEDLIRKGEWSQSMVAYTAGCEALDGEQARGACRDRGSAIYGAHHESPAPPAAAPQASVPSPAIAAAPSVKPLEFVRGAPQPAAYAVIIGIEHYDGLPPPTGAVSDAQAFAQVAHNTLGIPDGHVKLLIDDKATKGGIERAIEWARTSVKRGGRIYFYYSGHGAPDTSSGASHVVPYDGDPKYMDQTTLALSTIVSRLGESPAHEVLAMFDSCFSGAGGRSILPPGARPLIRVKDLQPSSDAAHVAVFSAASGSEISGPSAGGDHGVFTKYLLDGLGGAKADSDGDGQISLAELAAWVSPRVSREAEEDHREQHPALTLGKGIAKGDELIVGWGFASK
jgi:hypothetical protein